MGAGGEYRNKGCIGTCLSRRGWFGHVQVETAAPVMENSCPRDGPSSSCFSRVSDQRQLSVSARSVSLAGASAENHTALAPESCEPDGEPGVCVPRELLPSTNGPPWVVTELAQREQARATVLGVVTCGLLGRANYPVQYMNQIRVTPVSSSNASSRISPMAY